MIYEVEDMKQARDFLQINQQSVVLTNALGSTRYYGFLTVDYMFKALQAEFPQISDIIINVGDDHSALLSAIKLGYSNIIYNGSAHGETLNKIVGKTLDEFIKRTQL